MTDKIDRRVQVLAIDKESAGRRWKEKGYTIARVAVGPHIMPGTANQRNVVTIHLQRKRRGRSKK